MKISNIAKITACTAAVLALTTAPSHAADKPGAYIGLAAVGTDLQDNDIKTGYFGDIGKASYKLGGGGTVNLGYDFGNVRTEAEYTFRYNETDKIAGFGVSDSRLESHAFMANLLFDIPTGTMIKPYIGGGAGYAIIDADGTDGKFAYQGMAGLNFDISDQTTFYTGYKYFAIAGNAKFDDAGVGGYSVDYKTNNVEAGFRLKLN